MNFSDLFRIILKKKWLFIIIFFIGFFISVGYYKFSEKEYRATAKIRVQSDNSDFSFGGSILSSLAKDASGIDNELALIGSEEILRNTIEKTGFDKILGLSEEQAAGYIKKYLLSYESAGNNNFIDIYFTFKDREPAIDFLNAFISEYNNKYIEIYDKELYNKKAFLEERLGYYSNLYDLQKKSLEKYMNYENDISFQKSYVSGLLSKYMTETESLTLEKESYDYSLSQLKEKQDEFNYNYELENSFPDLVSVKKLIFDTELSLFDLKNKYSQDNSSVESLEARLEYLRTQYNKTLESAINNLGISSSAYTEFIKNSENIKMQREIAVMKTDYFSKRIDELKKEYSDISEDAFEYETVKALADYYSKMISQYKQKTEELYVSIGTSFSNIYTVDKPFAPSLPNLPSLKKTALFGGIATLFAAFFISYFSFVFTKKIRTSSDIFNITEKDPEFVLSDNFPVRKFLDTDGIYLSFGGEFNYIHNLKNTGNFFDFDNFSEEKIHIIVKNNFTTKTQLSFMCSVLKAKNINYDVVVIGIKDKYDHAFYNLPYIKR